MQVLRVECGEWSCGFEKNYINGGLKVYGAGGKNKTRGLREHIGAMISSAAVFKCLFCEKFFYW